MRTGEKGPGASICLVSSPGGHLTEVRALREAYIAYRHFYVVNERLRFLPEDMTGRTYFIRHAERDWLVLVNFVEAFKILRREKPAAILTVGAGPAVPFAIVGRLLGIPTVYVETLTRICKPSLTGRLMYHIASRFYYQWPQLALWFPEGVYAGGLLDIGDDSTGVDG